MTTHNRWPNHTVKIEADGAPQCNCLLAKGFLGLRIGIDTGDGAAEIIGMREKI